jgi:maltooligosyltrehalose trehalohydrolase
MKRVHRMPFGAEPTEAGVRFRLWAPSASAVALCLDQGEPLPMRAEAGGWYALTTDKATAGSRYRFRIDGELQVPDPASRYNGEDVHGPSEVIDPSGFDWQDDGWRGRPWHEAVVYELHVGSFSDSGDFAGVEAKLDELVAAGITAVELMPVADFPGERNWGYDGVLPFAPDSSYGQPEDLKRLVQSAHRKGLMVLLDVVYNHFGPEGNYLHAYAKPFFTDKHQTPWGAAINFDDAGSRQVRDFFIHNALYWLEEYHLDGLRLDAVHAIRDDSKQHILAELAEAVRAGPGRERQVHLVLENEANNARYLSWGYDAQWNDDIHHCFHVLLTGEADGYYSDYADKPHWRLARCLAEGYAYQGEHSQYHKAPRGEPSRGLPPLRFVSFLQNHDQIGNRAFGERLTELAPPEALKAAMAILLLAPSPPMLYMGEEWGTRRRFPFFCDFGPELAKAVTEGRRREFARFERFQDPKVRDTIPDPSEPATFEAARLDWRERDQPEHAAWLAHVRQLLQIRRDELMPRLENLPGAAAEFQVLNGQGIAVAWQLGDGSRLTLTANLSDQALAEPLPEGRPLFVSAAVEGDRLPPWSVAWLLENAHG